MQSRRTHQASKQRRRGFTLIELLVVISIIATLMSLILPAIQNAREAGRRTQCLNNLRNVTVAVHNFASSNKSRLPALAYFPSNGGSGRIEGRSWVVELLPFMDQQGTYDRWDKSRAWNSTATNVNGAKNFDLANDLYIEALVCPNDESAFQVGGGLTYVANAGFGDFDPTATTDVITNSGGTILHSFLVEPFNWDEDSNTPGTAPGDDDDSAITQSTGVFWAEFDGQATTKNASVTLGKVYDGTSNTLMFGENIKSGVNGTTWADPRTAACGFIYAIDGTKVDHTTLGNPLAAITTSGSPTARVPAYPNESKNAPQGSVPFLTSAHPGITVVAMVDGSAKTLSDGIDKTIYTSLMTPAGTRLRSYGAPPQSMVVEDPISGEF